MTTTITDPLEELIKPNDESSEIWLREATNQTLIAHITSIDDGVATAELTELGEQIMTTAELAKRYPYSLEVKLAPDLRHWEGKITGLNLVKPP